MNRVEALRLACNKGTLDGGYDADVEQAFLAIGLGVFVVEDAVGEVLQLAAELIGLREDLGSSLLCDGLDVLHSRANLIGGLGEEIALFADYAEVVHVAAVVADGEGGYAAIVHLAFAEAEGDGDCVVEVEAVGVRTDPGGGDFDGLGPEEVADHVEGVRAHVGDRAGPEAVAGAMVAGSYLLGEGGVEEEDAAKLVIADDA